VAPDHDTTALIVGGGVAGLTAAIALERRGIDALVLEQSDDVRKAQVGAGLSLGLNVTRAFEHLGLLEELTQLCAPIKDRQFMTDKGKDFGTAPIAPGDAFALGVLRPRFHEFLVGALGNDKLQAGANVVRFDQDGGGVTAHFADGRTARGAVLIGADGIKSTIRKQLFGDSELRYAGYVTRRGILESEAARDGLERVVLGRGERFVHYPVGRWWMYWTMATNEPPGGTATGPEIKQRVLELLEGWPEPLRVFVEGTGDANLFLADTYDREPLRRWGEGRVSLLGDAAHPMTWDRAQGASQGIEGAVLLAGALARDRDDPAAALRAWEAERIPRTTKIVNSSRRVGKLAQTENPLPRLLHRVGVRITTWRTRRGWGANDLEVDY
jgi:2-polyprenyl-6-methoxyphenol hydroxylase-like FAD-dependent oxidoreductase